MARNGLLKVAGFVVLLFALAGCLEVSTIVSVKPDGTGTITDRTLMSKASIGQMSALTEGGNKGQAGAGPNQGETRNAAREIGHECLLMQSNGVAIHVNGQGTTARRGDWPCSVPVETF